MGVACVSLGNEGNAKEFLWWNLKERDYLQDLNVDLPIIVENYLGQGDWTGFI